MSVLALLLALPFFASAQNLDYGAVPALTQPQGDQSAANQKLDFHADLFTGRFNYAVPIEVPPGRGGSAPSIALQYNSATGNGWCGVGWDLDFGYIQRETRHGVPISGSSYADSFGFIFSVAGQSGRLVLASDGTYRPEVDTAFLKFVRVLNSTNDYWLVTDKNGTQYTFGSLPVSTVSGPYAISGTFKWMLNTIQDANGNLTSFGYQTYGDKQLYPYQVAYNANTNNAALANTCFVTFRLTSRSDIPNSCISGQEIPTQYLINDITVSNNNQLVRDYYLQYTTSPSTGRSLLHYVTEYGTDDATHWPTITFNYSVQNQSFQPIQYWPIASQGQYYGDPYWTSPATPDTQLIDMNGDGLPDWVSSERGLSGSVYDHLIVQTNTGSGFGPAQNWAVDNETHDTSDNWNSVGHAKPVATGAGGSANYTELIDINGDGLPDRVMSPGYNGSYFQVQTNTGNGFSSTITHWTVPGAVTITSPAWSGAGSYLNPGSYTETLLVDMGGDGLVDLLMLGSTSGQFSVGLNQGAGAANFSLTTWSGVSGTQGIRYQDKQNGITSEFMDMNGDGLPDRVLVGGVQLNLGLYGSSGTFDYPQSWGLGSSEWFASWYWLIDGYTRQLVDLNGDGLPDMVTATTNATFDVRFNTGNGFVSSFDSVTWTGVAVYTNTLYGLQTCDSWGTTTMFLDMNGDGLPDRVVRNAVVYGDYLGVQLNSGPFPDLLTSVDNGIGGIVTVTYTNASVFNNSDGTRPRLPFPMNVVTSVTEYGGANPQTTTSYNYQYGLYDFTWREFRGFGLVSTFSPDGMNGTIQTDTYFHQGGGMDFSSHGEYQDTRFKAGMPYDVITYGSDGNQYRNVLSQVTQVQLDSSGVYFPFVTNVFVIDTEASGPARSTLKQYTYAITPNNLAASTGNLLREADLGEVTNIFYSYAYTDVGDSPVYTTYSYATLSNPDIINKPATVTVSADAAGNNILRKTQYAYFGATGNLQEKSELICPGTYANTFYTYDSYGNTRTVTDPMGIVTTTDYDAATVLFPWRKVTGSLTNLMQYDPRDGQILAATNEQGIVSLNTYDALRRLTSSAISTTAYGTPSLVRSRYFYSFTPFPAAVHVAKNDPASPTGWHDTSTYMDGLGRTVQVRDQSETNGQYRVSDYYYDSAGHLAFESYPIFSAGSNNAVVTAVKTCTWSTFDAIGRLNTFYPCVNEQISGGYWVGYPTVLAGDSGSPVGPTIITYRDGNNPWALVITNALGKAHKYLLDAFGRTNQIVEVTSGGNYTTTLAYNQVGDLTNITDNANNKIATYYDLAGQRVALTDPDMGYWQYGLDLDGRLKIQTDAKGQQTKLYYNDAAGRLTRREGWSASGTCLSTNTWTYDANGGDTAYTVYPGQTFMVTDDEGWQKFSYDARGRVLKSVRYLVKNGNAYTNQFTFDDAERVTSTAYPNGGPVITNLYDAGGHIAQVKQFGGASFYTAKGFNVMNQLNGINFGNGVGEIFGYYSLSKRLQQITTAKTTNIQSLAYSFDADGNIKGVTDGVYKGLASGTIGNIQYDDLNRLLALTNGSGAFKYGYNSIGNILTNYESGITNYAYGSIRPHAVRSANGTWFTYDQNGNVVFRGNQRLDYDVNNRLYRVINTNGTVTFFGYAADGARLWEQSGTNPLQVWIDGNYEEKQGQKLYHISAGDRLVCTFDKTGTNVYQYYHPDDLTSTSIQTDANGSLVQNYEYSAFGQSRYTLDANLFKVSRRYTGQILDEDTGLYYYNARYYDPQIGRFTQPDNLIPNIFNPQAYNRYSYCINNPLRYTDPSGHGPAEVIDSVANFCGGVVVGVSQVLNPVPVQFQHVPAASTPAESSGRELGAGIGASISTAEMLAGGTIAAGGGTIEVASAGVATPIAVPAVGVGTAMAAHGVNGINNYLNMNHSAVGNGVNNPTTQAAADMGNKVHYDNLNGGKGEGLPTELTKKYPETEFRFTKRGEKGPDVEVTGGKHPSDYPGSTWKKGNNFGDFKPNTDSGLNNFNREVKNGKLPGNTERLPYDSKTGKLN